MMNHRDGHIIYVKTNEIVGRFLGGLENLITLSFSQALASKRGSTTSYYSRGAPASSAAQAERRAELAPAMPRRSLPSPERASTAFLGEIQGRPDCFLSPATKIPASLFQTIFYKRHKKQSKL